MCSISIVYNSECNYNDLIKKKISVIDIKNIWSGNLLFCFYISADDI